MKNKKTFILFALLISITASVTAQIEIINMATTKSSISINVRWRGGQVFVNGVSLKDSAYSWNNYYSGSIRITPVNGRVFLTATESAQVEEFYCSNNQLTQLNLTNLTYLQRLSCDNNKLTVLNLNNCPKLTTLYCHYNQLTTLNITGRGVLEQLVCSHNLLSSLDLNGCAKLNSISIDHNRLTSLSLNPCKQLTHLDCTYNRLTDLDLYGRRQTLTRLYAEGQYITIAPENQTYKWLNPIQCLPYTDIIINNTLYGSGSILPSNIGPILLFSTEQLLSGITGEAIPGSPLSGTIMLVNHPEWRPVTDITIISALQIEASGNPIPIPILTPVIAPSDATDKTVRWNSSNPDIASIKEDHLGNITISSYAEGNTVLTATTMDGNKTTTCNVTIVFPKSQTIAITDITIAPASLQLQTGDTETLTSVITPTNATNKSIIWTSDNHTVATVSANGIVTAHSVGSATISASTVTTISATTVEHGKTAICNIIVTDPQPETITINPTMLELKTGNSATITATITPTNAANKSIVWVSDNPTVATVSTDGIVTAHAKGSATISATTVIGNKTALCTIFVDDPRPEAITVTPTMLQLQPGHSAVITAYITPANAVNKSIIWQSDNIVVATVSTDGTVIAHSEGIATISATTVDGSWMALCTVFVDDPQSEIIVVTNISVTPTTLQLQPGYSAALTPNITPNNATDKSVIWATNNVAVASVSTDGIVTAHSNGSAVISATTVDGNKTAFCNITVAESQTGTIAITGISVNPATLQLKSGYSSTLTANITPSNATNQSIIWASNNSNIATVSANGVVTAHSPGVAIVSAITVENGLMATCNINVMQSESTSNETVNIESLMVYPNPTNGKVTISGLTYDKKFHIYNQMGLLITTFVASEEKMTIDLSHLNSGIYFLKTKTKTLKIIIL